MKTIIHDIHLHHHHHIHHHHLSIGENGRNWQRSKRKRPLLLLSISVPLRWDNSCALHKFAWEEELLLPSCCVHVGSELTTKGLKRNLYIIIIIEYSSCAEAAIVLPRLSVIQLVVEVQQLLILFERSSDHPSKEISAKWSKAATLEHIMQVMCKDASSTRPSSTWRAWMSDTH